MKKLLSAFLIVLMVFSGMPMANVKASEQTASEPRLELEKEMTSLNEDSEEYYYIDLDWWQTIEYGKSGTITFELRNSDWDPIADVSDYTIRWENEEGEILQHGGTSYTIEDAGKEHAGFYCVYVEKGEESKYAEFEVEIDTKLSFHPISEDDRSISAKLDESVKLDATASSLLGTLQYTWKMAPMVDGQFSYDYDEAVPIKETSSTLVIDQVAASDYGYYICEVTDGINTIQTEFELKSNIKLTAEMVQDYVNVVNLKDKAELSVAATSQNQITYQWYKDDVILDGQTKATLVIDSMSEADYGEYECVVRDGINKRYCYASLRTFDLSPEFTTGKYSEVDGKSYVAFVGSKLTLDLSKVKKADHANLTFEWYKNSDWDGPDDNKELVQKGSESSYVIKNVEVKSETNTNEYYVKVTDGTSMDSMYIWVKAKEQMYFEHEGYISSGTDMVNAIAGKAFSYALTPILEEGYSATYQWYKTSEDYWDEDSLSNSTKVEGQTTPTLSFTSLSDENFKGFYYCIATVSKDGNQTLVPSGFVELKKVVPEEYKVTFNANGGTEVTTQVVVSGEKVQKPTDPKRAGYLFKGWELESKGYDFATPVKQNITLKAVWEAVSVVKPGIQKVTNTSGKNLEIVYSKVSGVKGYEIQYSENQNMKDAKTINVNGESITSYQIANLAYKKYYVQVRAYKLDSMNQKVYGAWSDVKSGEIKQPIQNYKVTFKSDGKTVKTQTVQKGKNATAPTVKKAGYTFEGWNKSYKNISGNITVTAKWKKVSVSKVQVTSASNAKGKKINVAYKKVSGAAGYEIRYSTKKNMKSSKTITAKSTKQNISKLSKKTYYVQVRAFKKDSNNKNVYGAWSATKKVVVKK